MIKKYEGEPREIVTDEVRNYGVAHRELSRQPTKVRERGMGWSDISGFKSMKQTQRFLNIHAAVCNLFNLGRVETAVIW